MIRRLEPGQLVGGEAGIAGELITLNEIRVARLSYAFAVEGAGTLHAIAYAVPAELGLYTVTFVADWSHAADLEKITDRAMPSFHVRSRPRFPPLITVLSFYVALPLAALFGLVFLLVRLASSRRGRISAVPWPGLRDEGTPPNRY